MKIPHVAIIPGRGFRILRRLTQSMVVLAVLCAPVLGGWQRKDRAQLATVEDTGYNLPRPLLDRLPAGQPAASAYRANQVLGGGIAMDVIGIPAMDPLAGGLAMLGASFNMRSVLALGLPILLALFAGRVFCGYLCIFGVIARALERLVMLFPVLPRFRTPSARPLRFAVLALGLTASLLGVHMVLYLSLPYLLVQQSIYAAWLLGGGSVVLAVLLGLLVAGLFFGPTLYCQALCPTGAVLGTLARARRVHLRVVNPPACSSHCQLCNTACWLQLEPRSGDPGPDCDVCGRCVPACPRTNLEIVVGKSSESSALHAAAAVLALLLPAHADAETMKKPTIVLERELRVGDATLVVSALDIEGTSLHWDWGVQEHGTVISVYLTRGPLHTPGQDGLITGREFYKGPLTIKVITPGSPPPPIHFTHANHPISAQRPSIYKGHTPARLQPGDSIAVLPVPGYLDQSVMVTVGGVGAVTTFATLAQVFLVAALLFSGLLSLSLALPRAPIRTLVAFQSDSIAKVKPHG